MVNTSQVEFLQILITISLLLPVNYFVILITVEIFFKITSTSMRFFTDSFKYPVNLNITTEQF